jgi:hypothetical protein
MNQASKSHAVKEIAMNKQPDWRKARKAYSAIERDSLSGQPELVARADAALLKLADRSLDGETFWHYVQREEEFRLLH